MTVTGQAKEKFEGWLYNTPTQNVIEMMEDHEIIGGDDSFNKLPESMQWGVYQDWADRLGYDLYISKESPLEYFWAVCDLIRSFNEGNCKTRQEARNAAIEKLNEIMNQS